MRQEDTANARTRTSRARRRACGRASGLSGRGTGRARAIGQAPERTVTRIATAGEAQAALGLGLMRDGNRPRALETRWPEPAPTSVVGAVRATAAAARSSPGCAPLRGDLRWSSLGARRAPSPRSGCSRRRRASSPAATRKTPRPRSCRRPAPRPNKPEKAQQNKDLAFDQRGESGRSAPLPLRLLGMAHASGRRVVYRRTVTVRRPRSEVMEVRSVILVRQFRARRLSGLTRRARWSARSERIASRRPRLSGPGGRTGKRGPTCLDQRM